MLKICTVVPVILNSHQQRSCYIWENLTTDTFPEATGFEDWNFVLLEDRTLVPEHCRGAPLIFVLNWTEHSVGVINNVPQSIYLLHLWIHPCFHLHFLCRTLFSLFWNVVQH